jgi:hypothetical protein
MVISEDQLEYYIDRDTMSWTKKAQELSSEYTLNEEGELKLTEIYEFKGHSKSELYHRVLAWISSLSIGTDSAVQIADEDKGQIVTNCCLSYMGSYIHISSRKAYSASIKPLLQFDFKDGKVRFVYTLQSYEILVENKRREHMMFMGTNSETQSMASLIDKESYLFKNNYPFVKDNSNRRKAFMNNGVKSDTAASSTSSKVSSCLYVNSIAFYHFIKDKIADVLPNKNDSNDPW